MPSKRAIFTPLSILFRPHQSISLLIIFWWRRRVPPPGPMSLLHCPFITIAGKPALLNIDEEQSLGKGELLIF